MSVLTRDTLEESTLADLHAIASELSIDGYRRLRKGELIETLLTHQGVEDAAEPAVADDDDEDGGAGTSRRRRGRRGGRGRTSGSRTDEGDSATEPEPPAPSSRGGRSRNGGRDGEGREGGSRDRDGRDGGSRDRDRDGRDRGGRDASRESTEEPTIVEGVVELLANGSGFVRVTPPEPSDDDVYISAAQVKRCELVAGDRVSGPRRPPHRSERYPSLVRIDTVNGRPADELSDRGRFDDLPAVFPTDRFTLDSEDPTLKAVDLLTPFGRGSRVAITGAAWSGKSHLLAALSTALAAQENVTVFVALAGVRPEELSEWNDGPVKPAAELTFSASSDAQDNAVELVVDQARRLAARGSDAIVLIDGLDGLHPLNARRAMAAARKLKSGGSLTVLATGSKPLGGETTVIALDAVAAMASRHPVLDVAASGTLRPELLVGDAGVKAIAKERAKAPKS
jgi:transcription termination factor Rho